MSLGLKYVTLPTGSQMAFRVALPFLLYRATGLTQQTQPEDTSLPQYDLHAETEIKRVIDEVNLLSLATREAFEEPIIKNGDDKVHIYLLSLRQTISGGDGQQFQKKWPDSGCQFKKKARLVSRGPRSRTEGRGHALAPRRQGQAGAGLANQQVDTGEEAR